MSESTEIANAIYYLVSTLELLGVFVISLLAIIAFREDRRK